MLVTIFILITLDCFYGYIKATSHFKIHLDDKENVQNVKFFTVCFIQCANSNSPAIVELMAAVVLVIVVTVVVVFLSQLLTNLMHKIFALQ